MVNTWPGTAPHSVADGHPPEGLRSTGGLHPAIVCTHIRAFSLLASSGKCRRNSTIPASSPPSSQAWRIAWAVLHQQRTCEHPTAVHRDRYRTVARAVDVLDSFSDKMTLPALIFPGPSPLSLAGLHSRAALSMLPPGRHTSCGTRLRRRTYVSVDSELERHQCRARVAICVSQVCH